MRNCPKCNFSVIDEASTCPRCGIVSSKYKQRLAHKDSETLVTQVQSTIPTTYDPDLLQEKRSQGSRSKLIEEIAVVFLVFLLAIYLFHFRKGTTPPLAEAVKIPKPALPAVRVFQEKPGTPFTEVNGFFFGTKDQLIICATLLREASFIEVKAFDGRVYTPAFLIGEDRASCLVKLPLDHPAKEVSIISAAEGMPAVGDRVFILDSKSASSESIIQTDVSQIDDVPGLGPVFRLGMAITEKMAGSPVFNSYAKMVGEATAVYGENGLENFLLPTNYLV